MGTSVSIAVSLLFVLIVFSIIGDEYPRVQYEFKPLSASLGIFTAMTVISVWSFYSLLIQHPGRYLAQLALWAGVLATGWYYWP